VRDNQQQKGQQNTAHRLQNLDGVFQAEYIPTRAPVLLIDDIYDSGWTLTLLSAILMHDGVCAVYPATLSCATSK
jgi:ATP-dependent DNA helicase RecQ